MLFLKESDKSSDLRSSPSIEPIENNFPYKKDISISNFFKNGAYLLIFSLLTQFIKNVIYLIPRGQFDDFYEIEELITSIILYVIDISAFCLVSYFLESSMFVNFIVSTIYLILASKIYPKLKIPYLIRLKNGIISTFLFFSLCLLSKIVSEIMKYVFALVGSFAVILACGKATKNLLVEDISNNLGSFIKENKNEIIKSTKKIFLEDKQTK